MNTKGKMMISCQESTFLISKKQQDKLSLFERIQLSFHLLMCRYCRRFSIQISWITKGIRRMNRKMEAQYVHIKLTDEQKKRIDTALRNNHQPL